MTLVTWLLIIGLGSACGVLGQCLRVLVGLYKASVDTPVPPFDATRLWISLLVGLIAGALAGIISITTLEVDKNEVLALVAAGYAGADFIEGFVGKYLSTLTLK